ncbi:MAG: hypothetical protein WCJ09_18365 [Planctomycetota bacterium]
MPDWSYRTVFQPLLFLFSAETGRDLALNAMGRLSRFPFGSTVIDLMGHMRPDRRLSQTEQGLDISGPVMIGHQVDPHGTATEALARFGVGLIEVGPVARQAIRVTQPVELNIKQRSIRVPAEPDADSLDDWIGRLSTRSDAAQYLARLTVATDATCEGATADCRAMLTGLAPLVNGFILATSDHALHSNWSAGDWSLHVQQVLECAADSRSVRPVWLSIRADLNSEQFQLIVGQAIAAGCRGVMVEGRVAGSSGGSIIGQQALSAVSATVARLRAAYGREISLIAGGVHEPIDALELRQKGANCVVVDSGLVFSGPGLPKRINEAVLYADHASTPDVAKNEDQKIPIQKFAWFWTFIQGAAMLFGGLLAVGIASTHVVLSYDEVFVGMSRAELNLINPRLLAFMQHDRVTLSGTMFAVAVLYLFLSWYGIRRGHHWAMVAVMVSALIGFATFFSFLGFGYFDPFHAFVSTIMFQFSLMAWQGELGKPEFTSLPNLRETPEWRWGQWGQLSFVIHGAVLVTAGLIISGVGCTVVFVPEDLEFMSICASDLSKANPRLIPLIAHDRASFGGTLIATGIAVLLTALWGFREGARWQWWMLLLSGIPAYGAAIVVHLAVGYTSLWHLAPAYGGLGLLFAGLSLLYPYLGRCDARLKDEWERITSTASGKVSCHSE